jgi:hypothetical protein
MTKLFRKIRQVLLTENKISKYLIYAIGEIVLVVIGILIALQLNNYNDYKKERKEEIRMLRSFSKDLSNDVVQLEAIIERESFVKNCIDSVFSILNFPDETGVSEFLELSKKVLSFRSFVINNSTFEESVASGKIEYVQNDSVRQAIFDYYKVISANLSGAAFSKNQQEFIAPLFTSVIFQTNEGLSFFTNKKNKLKPLIISDLSSNSEFNRAIGWRLINAEIQIQIWKIYKENANQLLDQVESELKD